MRAKCALTASLMFGAKPCVSINRGRLRMFVSSEMASNLLSRANRRIEAISCSAFPMLGSLNAYHCCRSCLGNLVLGTFGGRLRRAEGD